jgi:hypothetical protein
MIGNDVNFPTDPSSYDLGISLTEQDLVRVRTRYLGYAYRAMARFSRGSVLIQDAKVITKEMVNVCLYNDRP